MLQTRAPATDQVEGRVSRGVQEVPGADLVRPAADFLGLQAEASQPYLGRKS